MVCQYSDRLETILIRAQKFRAALQGYDILRSQTRDINKGMKTPSAPGAAVHTGKENPDSLDLTSDTEPSMKRSIHSHQVNTINVVAVDNLQLLPGDWSGLTL